MDGGIDRICLYHSSTWVPCLESTLTHIAACRLLSQKKKPFEMQFHGDQSIPHKTGKFQNRGMGGYRMATRYQYIYKRR